MRLLGDRRGNRDKCSARPSFRGRTRRRYGPRRLVALSHLTAAPSDSPRSIRRRAPTPRRLRGIPRHERRLGCSRPGRLVLRGRCVTGHRAAHRAPRSLRRAETTRTPRNPCTSHRNPRPYLGRRYLCWPVCDSIREALGVVCHCHGLATELRPRSLLGRGRRS